MTKDEIELVQLNSITEKIIGCAYTVANKLGAGFLEKIYENAMHIELSKLDLIIEKQKPISVYYDKQIVGEYFADFCIENHVIIELKAIKCFDQSHEAQLMNYLKACNLRCGLLINFGTPKIGVKRILNGY